MMEPWYREFAEAEVPIRSADPLDVEVVAVVEGQRDAAPLEFFGYDPIVDSRDGPAPAVLTTPQLTALANDRGRVHRADTPHSFGRDEVSVRLLVERIDLHQDDLARIVAAQQHASHQLQIAVAIQASEEGRQSLDVIVLKAGIRQNCLKAEERRKRLQLDQTCFDAGRRRDEPEIHLDERGPILTMRDVKSIRDDSIGGLQVLRRVQQLADERCRYLDQPIEQRPGKETRSLGEAEPYGPAHAAFNIREKGAIPLGRELTIEQVAQRWNHT